MYRLLSLLAIVLTLHACGQREDIGTTEDPVAEGGVRLELSGSMDLGLDIDPSDMETLKVLTVYQKDADGDANVSINEPFTYEIDTEEYKGPKMTIFLRRRGSQAVTTVYAPVEIMSKGNGAYTMKVELEHVYPPSGESFAEGQWYISGFWGGGTQPQSATGEERARHHVAGVTPISPKNLGDRVEMDIPLGFPWTPISGKQIGPTYVLKNLELAVRPMGVILSLQLENRTKYPVEIIALDKEMMGFSASGYFDAAASSDEEMASQGFPKFRPSVVENVQNETIAIPEPIQVLSGETAAHPLYLWIMPTSETKTSEMGGHPLSCTFISKKRTTMDEDLPVEDRFSTTSEVGEFSDRYTIDLSFLKTPANSQYFFKKARIRASLMITEYFINRHRTNLNLPPTDPRRSICEPNFCGFVELYNPNIDPILLENYALARVANLRTVAAEGSTGQNYAFMHPFARELYSAWQKKYASEGKDAYLKYEPDGTADRGADEFTQSHLAVLISLQLKNGAVGSFQPNSLGFKSHLETGNGIQKCLEANESNDTRTERVRFLKGGLDSDGKARLQGGKTMLLLGNAFLQSGDPANIPYYRYVGGKNDGFFPPDNAYAGGLGQDQEYRRMPDHRRP